MVRTTLVIAAGIAVALPMFVAPARADSTKQLAQIGVEIHTDKDRERFRERRDCREVTIRERRGDEVIVRHERRCD